MVLVSSESTRTPLSVTGRGVPDTLSTVNIRVLVALLVLVGLPGCETPVDRADEAPAGNGDQVTDEARFRAAYLTSLTFVGFHSPASLVHVRYENRSDGDQLALSYEGWLAEPGGWNNLLTLRDTIPVPRAAWRVVPAGDSRLRVGDGAQIESISLPLDSAVLRLDALDAISVWSSSTGQRETLGSAELTTGSGAEAGLLLQQRRARVLDEERPAGISQTFVFTDSIGNALIILDGRSQPDVPASVWAWINGERIEWSDALMLPLSSPASAPGRWSLEVPERDMTLEIEGRDPSLEAASASGSTYRLFPVRATLSVADERLTMVGIRIEDIGP